MTIELGNTLPTGTAQAIRNVLEAVRIAEETGPDFCGFGEHHTRQPESVLRAVEEGLPMFLGILGGSAEHRAQYGHAYREVWAPAGHPAKIAVAVHGVRRRRRPARQDHLPRTRTKDVHPRRRRDPPHRPAAEGGERNLPPQHRITRN